MHDIDDALFNKARELRVMYTRYADDITVSGKNKDGVLEFERFMRSQIGRTASPSLTFNEAKRGLYVRGQRQMVTGLIVTPDHTVSIGRQRKRLLSACIHRVAMNRYDEAHLQYTRGLLAFAKSVEPSLLDRMTRKYGSAVMRLLISIPEA